MESFFLSLIGVLAILIILFLICREIVNWYWKINERISLQKETNTLLRTISQQLSTSEKTSKHLVEKVSERIAQPISDQKYEPTTNKNINFLCKKWKLTNTTENDKNLTNSAFKTISIEINYDKTFAIIPEYSSIGNVNLKSGTWDIPPNEDKVIYFQLDHIGIKFKFLVTEDKLILQGTNYTNTYIPI